MKTTKAFGKYEMIVMSPEEFREWMKDKTCYHHTVHWVEKWVGSETSPIETYIPCEGFILSNTMELKHYGYHGYSAKCLGTAVLGTKDENDWPINYWRLPHWKATINERTKKIHVRVLTGKEKSW